MKSLLLLFILVSSSLMAYSEVVYLGTAFSPFDCSRIAGSYGYPYYQYGGYWGGYYIINGCFGVYPLNNPNPPQPQPQPGCKSSTVQTESLFLKVEAQMLKREVTLSKQANIYEPGLASIQNLASLANELREMAKDQDSCQLMQRFFINDIRPAFEELKEVFLPLHHKALDAKVGEQWVKLEQQYRKLRSELR